MFAVIRNLENLIRLDKDARFLVTNVNITLKFQIRKGPSLTLQFRDGTCQSVRNSDKADIHLLFTSSDHFNQMIVGTKNPIPVKGLTKIKFMTETFVQLTERLEYFLKPSPEKLEDDSYVKIHTALLLYTAGYAIEQIGNYDCIGRQIAEKMPEGAISLDVEKGPAMCIFNTGGRLRIRIGRHKHPRAVMSFKELKYAYELLNGYTDSYTAIASGNLELRGFIPMLDQIDKLLYQVSFYLN